MFGRSKAKLEARIERERDRFKTPRTKEGVQLSNAEITLYAAVLVAVVLLISIAPKKMPMVHLVIFSLGVLALSQAGKDRLLPPIYAFLAAKFHWNGTYEQAVTNESAARAAERNPVPVAAPAATTAPEAGLDAQAKELLTIFFGLSPEDRRAGLDRVLNFFKDQGRTFPDLDDAESPDERFTLAQVALKRLAKQNGITTGGAA